eukprot:m.77913 g.77913  ORF g.77913 m.77913 type:complete len:457 (+) comp11933_c0_seq1:133-1503(+)
MSKSGLKLTLSAFGDADVYGCILEGLPEGVKVNEEDVIEQLKRVVPGTSMEKLNFHFVSGVSNGMSVGTPILCQINVQQPHQDDEISPDYPRPSQPDYAYTMKFGSALPALRVGDNELMGRMGGGVAAEKWLFQKFGVDIIAFVSQIGSVSADMEDLEYETIARQDVVGTGAIHAPNARASKKLLPVIAAAREENDTVGGVITCVCRNLPEGWGEPVFESLEGSMAKMMFSMPHVKGFTIGSGLDSVKATGKTNNDMFTKRGNRLGTTSNNCGGVLGGVSNGETVYFTIAFAPNPRVNVPQTSTRYSGESAVIKPCGSERYDPCTVPKFVPVVESLAALVLADLALIADNNAHTARNTPASGARSQSRDAVLPYDDLQKKYEKEAKLREAFQTRLTKRVRDEARAVPKHYLYPGLVVGGILVGMYLGRRWFGSFASSSSGFGSYSSTLSGGSAFSF